MQKFLKTITALMLMIAVLCAVGCKKDDSDNGGNNNGGGNNSGGENGGGTVEGMYVGVIGFNEALYSKQISLLNNSTEGSFLSFIESLTKHDATALYHADNTALNWLREATLPADLISVSLVTFTDGLDNASLMLDNNYSSQAEFLNAINRRIMNDKVQGKSINAYAVGMKGNDVVDEESFRQNLRKLSSSQSNVFEVEDMDEATERFSEIASQLYNESTEFGLSVKIPGGYDNNTVVRITFDNVQEANSSSRYIQATFSREGGNGKLNNISYNGLQSTSGTSIMSDRQDGLCYWYTFMELRTFDNELVTDLSHTKLWRMVGNAAEWQPESEFTPSNYSDIIVDRKSAVTVLVLDCTTSLGSQDFRKMKDAAKEFIRVLNDNGSGNGGNTLPTVVTNEVTDITSTSAVCGGKVTSNGGAAVIERGICWGMSHNPTTSGSHANNGTGTGNFTCNITGLSAGTTYYVRAYAINSHGTSYGNEVSFVATANLPTLSTNAVSDITQTTARCGGNVTATGGVSITQRGVCWSTSSNPTISNSHANTTGTGTGSYALTMTGLTANTTYYVRAYATNSVGTAYGNERTFTTLQNVGVPTVITNPVTNITLTTATGSGNVTATGGADVTERGICWSTSHNPTINGSHATNGTGTGTYTANMTGLTANTTYYVRAYAKNSKGVGYGNEVNFTTLYETTLPTVNTTAVTDITQDAATSGGNVTATGVADVTERGICWSTNHNPTISGSHANNGMGTGSYTIRMTGLTANTTYFVRAYAINSVGTSYGNELSFTTEQVPTYTISVSANPTNEGTVSGGGSYQQGQTCTVHAIANSGYAFNNWIEGMNVVSSNPDYTFTVTGNRTLKAVFITANSQSYTVSVSANPTNGGTVSGGGSYTYGQSCTVTATANTDYNFLRWTQNGSQVSTNANYTFTVNGNRTLVAQFQAQSYIINVSANPSSGGNVTGGGSYNYGQTCRVHATANEGYHFVNWTENGTQVSAGSFYTFTVSGDRNLVANFTANPNISVSANPSTGGTVSGGGSYRPGQSCTVSATANNGYSFTNWTENGNVVSTNANYTFTVSGDRTLVANFTATISVSANPSTGGTVSGGGTYQQGQSCTVSAMANNAYSFANWSENGSVVSSNANYTFEVNGCRTLVANFIFNGDGHEYVDLGLPSGLLWANCNVGADFPEDYGHYFAWGEILANDYINCGWNTYQYCMGSHTTLTKYCYYSNYGYNGFTDNLTVLETIDDAVSFQWGNGWRMPTKEEWQELLSNTTVTWTIQNGVNGILFTATNGNSLFLPAAGKRDGNSFVGAGSLGCYWSSSLDTDYPPDFARELYFLSNSCRIDFSDRCIGHSVRPVRSDRKN